jgi:hypothetical protein
MAEPAEAPALALVRVDDLGPDEERDRAVIASLLEARVTISGGVVPGWLQPATTRFLVEMRRRHGARLEVHQHGYAHVDRWVGDHKAEFGAFRDAVEQRAELRRGMEILTAELGDLVWAGFSPPFGARDLPLLHDLRACGFRAVSTLRAKYRLAGLPDFPTAVDACAWAPTRERAWTEVVAEWRRLDGLPFLGLVLHPRFMAWSAIRAVGERVQALVANRRSLTLEELSTRMPQGA